MVPNVRLLRSQSIENQWSNFAKVNRGTSSEELTSGTIHLV